jgi:hypothetical protein
MKLNLPKILVRASLAILLFTLAILHCASRINLLTADLGRHLRNGELFVNAHYILKTNLYSYTNADYPAICHHWASGVLFYFIDKAVGFTGTSIFYAGMLALTVLLFLFIATRLAGFWPGLLASVLALPLVAYRTEIRPEGLTTLFFAIYLILLMEFRARKISGRWLWALLPLQVLWVNSHVFFCLGFFLIGLFAVEEWVRSGTPDVPVPPSSPAKRGEKRGESAKTGRRQTTDARRPASDFRNLPVLAVKSEAPDGSRFKLLWRLGLASVAVSLLNPFGLAGLLEPFNIFRQYGYELAENQTVFFMMKRFPENVIYRYFLVLLLFAALLQALWAWKEKDRRKLYLSAVLLAVFGLMAVKVVRTIAMFGFVLIPLFAEGLSRAIEAWGGKWRERMQVAVAWLAGGMLFAALVFPADYFSPLRKFAPFYSEDEARYKNSYFYLLSRPERWAGLLPGVNGSADFFRGAGLKGPIFNNYDIGGYLIYHLFPTEKTFVDNRPEAYPAKFFKDVYVPAQENEIVWQNVAKKYDFQVIYFYHRDITPWAQPFLIQRIRDPQWAPVFADQYAIILVKRGGVNQAVIDRYEISKDVFQITENAEGK